MFNLFRKQGLIPGHPELKPCPFCGETPVIEHSRLNESRFTPNEYYYTVKIMCPRCNIGTKDTITSFQINGIGNLYLLQDGVSTAAKIWNTRAESEDKEIK